jgi:hypothetical protein
MEEGEGSFTSKMELLAKAALFSFKICKKKKKLWLNGK